MIFLISHTLEPSPESPGFWMITIFGDNMKAEKLLEKCEDAYCIRDFESLLKLNDEVLGIDPQNPVAISYRSISQCFLNQPRKALETLKAAADIHPRNYYHKNIAAMA